MGVNGGKGARLFSVVPIGRHEAVNMKIKAQEIPSEHKKTLSYIESGQTLQQFAHRGCEFSICGN